MSGVTVFVLKDLKVSFIDIIFHRQWRRRKFDNGGQLNLNTKIYLFLRMNKYSRGLIPQLL